MTSGLVLSAGGMFGAYQAGAWSYLADRFRPDLVVGTSAGSINGWLIASGICPDELIAIWRDPRLAEISRFVRRPGPGVFDFRPLAALIRDLATSYTPRIPFALTMVELPRPRLRLVRTPEITWQHLLAACAIPGLFAPVAIDGKRYVDGGVLGVLPLWAAAEMGAGRVVAVNALPLMPSRLVRGAARLIRRLSPAMPTALPSEIIHIQHDSPLGSVRDALYWDAANVERWIECGAADAAHHFRLE